MEEENLISIDEEYFFDSSAIIEILKQNPIYEPYKESAAAITIFNLAEIYFVVLSDYDESKANTAYETYKSSLIEVTDEIIKEAMKFRKENKNKGFSYADSIGYICAKHNNLKFLTSDSQFKGLENVEFVK